MARFDSVGFLERAYDLQSAETTWLRNLAEVAQPLWPDRSHFFGAVHYRAGNDWVAFPEMVPTRGGEFVARVGKSIARRTPWPAMQEFLEAPGCVRQASTFGGEPGWPGDRLGIGDALVVLSRATSREGIILGSMTAAPARIRGATRAAMERVAAHLEVGFRLRRFLARRATDSYADAILDPAGRVEHARAELQSGELLGSLRDTVRQRESLRDQAVRRPSAQEPGKYLEFWTPLVNGRWSLLDHFEENGRRFYVAVEHRAGLSVGGQSGMHAQVLQQLALGRSDKEIAYALGIKQHAASDLVQRVLRHLGLGSRSRATAAITSAMATETLRLGGVNIHIARSNEPAPAEGSQAQNLSPAERAIVAMVLAGLSARDIARRREVAVQTVYNQLHRLYAKLGAHSRGEFVARLRRPRSR